MELKIQREWLERMAEKEGNGIVSVGGLAVLVETTAHKQAAVNATERSVLAQLVQWQRRSLRLTVEVLAKRSDVDLEEILMIETGKGLPEARTMYKIAEVLRLPASKLMKLAGLVDNRDPNLGNAALRFAACSASIDELTVEETRVLEEFVRALGE